ncbi:hypothetical protein Hanom_Chr07g00602211 [Helianthus anomalus]
MKDVNLIESAHELTSRAKLSSSSARLQTEPSWLVYNQANFEPSFFRTFFERAESHEFFEHPQRQNKCPKTNISKCMNANTKNSFKCYVLLLVAIEYLSDLTKTCKNKCQHIMMSEFTGFVHKCKIICCLSCL